jgi:GTP cyclohydrolase I
MTRPTRISNEEEPMRSASEIRGPRTHVAGVLDRPSPAAEPRQLEASARVTEEDRHRFKAYLGEIFSALGMDMETPGTRRTPERFLDAMLEATKGYEGDPKLITAFPTECRGGPDCHLSQVIEGPIAFWSLCEHHALPFSGVAHVGYVAHDQIIGISKLTRLVRVHARRFTVQERIGQEIVDALVDRLRPHAVAVHLEAQHACTQMRGVHEEGSWTRTSFWRGTYETEPEMRREFLQAVDAVRR